MSFMELVQLLICLPRKVFELFIVFSVSPFSPPPAEQVLISSIARPQSASLSVVSAFLCRCDP